MVVADAAMETVGVTLGVTVIVTGFEGAVAGDAFDKEDVITTVTTSLFASDDVWYVALFVPALFPFTFH